ncbi:choice-of-anchor X domain-containing protein [Xanthomonas graminis]|uniref:choice-of-anchor X domain-containing protein n=1 Tax=Xanthomonas graminis TaxID=3390026 RepID=UPI001F478D61|nr:choice-of-anchor X domain-containing protein [Xanthomonas translucens]UKE73250.1 conditioned medium factor [Xanthomonas translucens pv. phleipratensis]
MPTLPGLSLLSTLLLSPLLAHAADLVPKQLAGPPEEFAQMRAPAPAEAAILSKSALLPVEFSSARSGAAAQWQATLPVENGKLRFVLLSGTHDWQPQLHAPGAANARADAVSIVPNAVATRLGSGDAALPAREYRVDGAANGSWTLTLRADGSAAQRGYLLMEGDGRTQLASYPSDRRQLHNGQRIGLTAMLGGSDRHGATTLATNAGRIREAQLRVTAPDGTVTQWPMADDGRHGDGAAGDGVYAGDFPAKAPGSYLAQVVVHGEDAAGQALVRTSEHVLPVLDTSLRIAADAVSASTQDGTRLALPIPVSAAGHAPAHYRVFGELWGTGRDGGAVPVAWLGGMLAPQNGRLPLSVDERWIVRAGAHAPFTLRNLRIEDPDHFVPLATRDTLALTLPTLRRSSMARGGTIDASMRMGERPATLQRAATDAQATGSRLVLVHGYCSGGVWPVAQFSNASAFLDVNQNRSNDQFAQLLAQFGSQWNSFGTVAHSQGGMAALHLYSYYWSGLDNASGGLVMQSVGTPYQGTNMAGIMATVGSWFGMGCGSNSDMTYDGAKAWLAGIPSSARALVNYYTTSFAKTRWYKNDYCNAASDLVLDDPEDGVVEKVNAQLPGGVNRGHTTGQCHTTGMRDPAQYLDASRNATMNANAAR